MCTSILAIVGDYYHPREAALQSLEQALDKHISNGKMELATCNPNRLLEKLAGKPDVVVLFSENRINPADHPVDTWMTEEIPDAITQYVENGGRWLAWHSGLASYAINGKYTQMLRGYFKYHPKQHQLVRYTNTKDNEILSDNFSLDLLDEHYFVHCDLAQTTVFLQANSVDGQSIAGWYHTYGNGKVCCLTPAHNKEGLLDPGFMNILEKCLVWVSA
jgi:type 1 glutamine amidotransferase